MGAEAAAATGAHGHGAVSRRWRGMPKLEGDELKLQRLVWTCDANQSAIAELNETELKGRNISVREDREVGGGRRLLRDLVRGVHLLLHPDGHVVAQRLVRKLREEHRAGVVRKREGVALRVDQAVVPRTDLVKCHIFDGFVMNLGFGLSNNEEDILRYSLNIGI